MKRAVAAVLVCLQACAHAPRGETAAPRPLRLCVQNETVGYGNLVARAGPVRFDVMPGRQECKTVPGTGPFIPLQAVTTSGGANGPLSFATRLQVGTTRCWTWRLTEQPGSANDLSPCDDDSAAATPRR